MARNQQASSSSDVCLYFLAIFISPLAVLLKTGCDSNFWINLALFILGWIPGVIHAWWVISKRENAVRGPGAYYNPPAQQQQYAAAPPPQGYAPPPQQYSAPATGADYGAVKR